MAYRHHSTILSWGDPIYGRDSILGFAMKRAAAERGITLQELVKVLGMYNSWAIFLVQGRRHITQEDAEKLASVLGEMPQHWLDLGIERLEQHQMPFDYDGNLVPIATQAPKSLLPAHVVPEEVWKNSYAFNDTLRFINSPKYTEGRHSWLQSTSDGKKYPMLIRAQWEMLKRVPFADIGDGKVDGRWTFQQLGPKTFTIVYIGRRRAPVDFVPPEEYVKPTDIVEVFDNPIPEEPWKQHINEHMAQVRKKRKCKKAD